MTNFPLLIGIFICWTGYGASWDSVLSKGWEPPKTAFLYGYSEFTPALQMGVRPYETFLDTPDTLRKSPYFREFIRRHPEGDRFGLSLYEEMRHLRPGLGHLARHWLQDMRQLSEGERPGSAKLKGIPASVLEGNAFWPPNIPKKLDTPIVSIAPLILSRTQEDLGHTVLWTVYGGSELNWEEIFWTRSFSGPATPWLCRLINKAFGATEEKNCPLKNLGVRILTHHPDWIPSDLRDLILVKSDIPTKYLVTFLPYSEWPESMKRAYREDRLNPIPHPSTLIFSEAPLFNKMVSEEARQLPLAIEFSQFSQSLVRMGFYGLRALDVSRRRHRFSKSDNNSMGNSTIGDNGTDPLDLIFRAIPSVMGIYGKPIGRNVQMWGVSGPLKGEWLLDGPAANHDVLKQAENKILEDGGASRVHYRNYFPVAQINGFDLRWYRPLVAWTTPQGVDSDFELLGSVRLTLAKKDLWFPVEVVDASVEEELAKIVDPEGNPETTAMNATKLFDFSERLHGKLTEDFANALLNPISETFRKWRETLPQQVSNELDSAVKTGEKTPLVIPLTFRDTATSEYGHRYWKKLVDLTEGPFTQKNNTDCAATDGDAQSLDPHCKKNDLPAVLDYLKRYYEDELRLPTFVQSFEWKVDFDIPWWDGLKEKQHNLIVVIHGKDGKPHEEAIVMGDHYDTAQMGDIYEGNSLAEKRKLSDLVGHRHSAKGADDNHSATATLMEAARVLKDLPLKKDVWLVHLTGEEFPADSLGTRALCQALIEKRGLTDRKENPKIAGVFVLDMVAHDVDRDKEGKESSSKIFQIAPGRGDRAARLAFGAHRVTQTWNHLLSSEKWNEKLNRKNRWKRYQVPKGVPPDKFPLPELPLLVPYSGEIRPGGHFRSSLYQTDIQLFADSGFPAVLFMENYDVNRDGYHDTLDNLELIDLDYASGLTAIAIETVAQAASQ